MDIMLLLDIVIAAFGLYMAGAGLKMKKTGQISPLVLTEEELPKVKDTDGFIAFFYWRELLFGLIVAAAGVLGILNETVLPFGRAASLAEAALFAAGFVWFWNSLGKAREKFL